MEIVDNSPYPIVTGVANDDEISSANTEDALISSRNSSETINSNTKVTSDCFIAKKKRKTCRGSKCYLICGIIFLLFGLFSIIWTPFDVLMNERLKMIPGFPPYEWWKNPPDEVLLRVYIFNVTNSREFLNGEDSKLKLQEIGPIIYREKLSHNNVTFNENGTMSYVAKRTAIYLPHMNNINLNDTLISPNLALLGMASYLHDSFIVTKLSFNIMVRQLNCQPFVNISIYNYLWNFTDPLLETAQKLVPHLVPVNNMGILHRIYSSFEDLVTVYIGRKYGSEKFFTIDKYHGSSNLPNYGENCADSIVNSTEGVAYAQFLTKNSTLLYWRKTICKVTPLYYKSETVKYGLSAYKFELPENTYDRKYPTHSDCYIGDPPLLNGLSDVSNCYYDFPMVASFPHFLYGDGNLQDFVDGLKPNYEKHHSFVYVEPTTGIPIESRARSQSNLLIRDLSGFNEKIKRFSNIALPMFWAEYNQVGLPWYIYSLMYFTVKILPIFEKCMTALFLLFGVIFLIVAIRNVKKRLMNKKRKSYVERNKSLRFKQGYFVPK